MASNYPEDESPSRKLIIPRGVLESGQNVIEIPESCEDSRVLIAKLQAKYNKPPRYYPPKTHPENRFERHIGDVCVGMGMPPLSPLREEPRNYKSSFSQYGPPKPPQYSCDPSYFGTDTTHGSQSFSGKFDYHPTSTPKPLKGSAPAPAFPSPKMSPIFIGRDIFATEPSVYRSAYTPPRPASPVSGPSPPRRPSPVSQRPPTPPQRSPCPSQRSPAAPQRTPAGPQRRPPVRRPPSPDSDQSCSINDISGMLEFTRSSRSGRQATPESLRGLSQFVPLAIPGTPVPEELDNSALNESLAELENVELEELRTVQEKMRNFQEARRELVLGILSLQEVDVPECDDDV